MGTYIEGNDMGQTIRGSRHSALRGWMPAALLALIALIALAAIAAAPASAAASRLRAATARPLRVALRPDGSLRHASGSFDAAGYRMVLGRHGAPRFLRSTAAASGPSLASTSSADGPWSESFGQSGIGPSVALDAVAISGSKIYVGGTFTTVGHSTGITYNNVAMWDGYGWHTLGGGVTGSYPLQVDAIAVLGSEVFVGGQFSAAGGTPVNNVAMWNGTGWSPVGGGITASGSGVAQVKALVATGTTSAPTLYAGGRFDFADGQTVNNIATWNGTNWLPLGAGLTGSQGMVNALLLSGSTLYVGGNFTGSGTTKFNSFGAWTGSAWSAIGGAGVSTSFGYPASVNALAINPTTKALYVAGNFAAVGGTLGSGGTATGTTAATNVAVLNGSTWKPLGSGIPNPVTGLTFWNGYAFASATVNFAPTVERWNGTSWVGLAQPLGGTAAGQTILSSSSAGMLAVGGFISANNGTIVLNELGLWNGSTWKGFGLGIANNVLGLASQNHDLYAVGGFTSAGYTGAINIAHYNGASWSSMGSAGITGAGGTCAAAGVLSNICTVAIDPATHHVFIGGSFSAINGVSASNVAMWNGSAWQALGQGVNGVVNALLVYNGKLYAGGSFTSADNNPASDVAQWNLSSGGWSALGDDPTFISNGNADGDVNTLAGLTTSPYNHYVLIGGGFPYLSDGSFDYVYNGLALFDTTASYTSSLAGFGALVGNGSGSAGVGGGVVYSSYLDGTNLYVGGNFTAAGGLSTRGFALDNLTAATGSSWSIPGSVSGGSAAVYALTKVSASLYLAGSFTGAGGVTASNVARYTPGAASPWSALGSGISAPSFPAVYALSQDADGLWAGGTLSLAGGKPSTGLALWSATAFPLKVSEVASPTSTTVGTPVTFTATVKNTASAAASGVTLTSSFTSGATFDSASSGCTQTSATGVSCSIGSLAAGASATVQIVLTPTATGYLTNSVTVRESGSSYTNSASVKVKVS